MLKRLRAWFERRRIEREAEEYNRGRLWAHHEIIFGRGYAYVEAQTYGVWDAFDRGAHEALLAHALNQEMLGRDVNERTLALADERFKECAIRAGQMKSRVGDMDDLLAYNAALVRAERLLGAEDAAHVCDLPSKDNT